MIIVLDASAALEVVLRREKASKLADILCGADWVIAPTLFVSEVSNAIWKYYKLANISFEVCEKWLDQAVALPDELFNEVDLYKEAFMLSCKMNHPVYDMMYLVLAKRNNAILLSLDQKLLQLARKLFVRTLK